MKRLGLIVNHGKPTAADMARTLRDDTLAALALARFAFGFAMVGTSVGMADKLGNIWSMESTLRPPRGRSRCAGRPARRPRRRPSRGANPSPGALAGGSYCLP